MEFAYVLPLLLFPYHAVIVKGQVTDSIACYFWEGAVYHQGHCFKYFPAQAVSRRYAEVACEEETSGGMLAESLGPKQLQDMMRLPVASSAWLAPTNANQNSQYFKNPSSPTELLDIQDPLWDRGQPVIHPGVQSCLIVQESGLLGSIRCLQGTANGYICQQEADNACQVQLPGSVYFQGSCFLYKSKRLNFSMAQASCGQTKSFLAEPITPELFQFVRDMAAIEGGNEWVGGQARLEHNYVMTWWKSGVAVSTNKSYWGSNPANENYLQIAMSENHSNLLKTQPDYKLLSYICQLDVGNPCESSYPGSVYAGGYCLKLYRIPLTWHDARAFCKKEGTSLVELTSDVVYHAASQLIKMMENPTKAFIGLSDHQTEGVFMWATSNTEVTSPKWADDQPMGEDFVAITNDEFQWVVLDEAATEYFICQRALKKVFSQVYFIPLVEVAGFYGNLPQQAALHVLSRIISHKVYIRVKITTPSLSSNLRYYVTHEAVLKLDLPREAYSDQFGVNDKLIKVTTSHPVAVTLYYSLVGVNMTTLLHTSLRNKFLPSSFLISTSGFAREKDDVIETQVAAIPAGYSLDVTFRFPGHVVGNAVVNVGGLRMNLTGDIEVHLEASQTAVIRLAGSVDGLFIYASHLVLVMVSSIMEIPSTEQISYITSPVLPSEVIHTYYITFPSIVQDDSNQKYFRDYFTVISLAMDNQVTVKGLTGNVKVILLPEFGISETFELPPEEFYIFQGPLQFYLIKHVHWDDGKTARSPCRANILPRRLWRKYYVMNVTPDPEVLEISLYLQVPDPYQTYLVLDGVLTNFTCAPVAGTSIYGCHIDLTHRFLWSEEEESHHVNIQDFASSLGAYVMVTSQKAIACYMPGMIGSLAPKNPAISLDDVYQPEVITTTASEPVTMETTQSSSLHVPSQPPTPTTITETATLPSRFITTRPIQSSAANQALSSDPPTPSAIFPVTTTTTRTPNNPCSNMTEEERLLLLLEIENRLKIDARSTSAFKRRKTSADDVRTSSAAIGLVGVAVMAIVFGFILCSDVTSAVCAIYQRCNNFSFVRRKCCRNDKPSIVS